MSFDQMSFDKMSCGLNGREHQSHCGGRWDLPKFLQISKGVYYFFVGGRGREGVLYLKGKLIF